MVPDYSYTVNVAKKYHHTEVYITSVVTTVMMLTGNIFSITTMIILCQANNTEIDAT